MSGSISATGAPTSQATSGANRATTGLGGDFNTFLTLLTTQLKNQDPSQPMDANALTNQLVQFAEVEQATKTNSLMERLIAVQEAGQMAASSDLVGRRVTLETQVLPLQEAKAEVRLPTAGAARRAVVTISDAAGTVLRNTEVPLGTSPTSFVWDGKDRAGTARPDGAYRVSVSGRAADGSVVALPTQVSARVTGVAREASGLVLRFGTATIGFDRLRELPNGG
jgi:flagellar basal-body rod modification protein FlgD